MESSEAGAMAEFFIEHTPNRMLRAHLIELASAKEI